MKKKVVLSVFSGLILITAILLVALFSAPIFYNTKYDVIDNNRFSVGTVEFEKDGTLNYKYWYNQHDYEETYNYTIIGDKLFIGNIDKNNMVTINNKFSLEQGNYQLTPSGGGVTAFLLLIITNAVAVVVVAGITLSYFIKKHNKNRENVA